MQKLRIILNILCVFLIGQHADCISNNYKFVNLKPGLPSGKVSSFQSPVVLISKFIFQIGIIYDEYTSNTTKNLVAGAIESINSKIKYGRNRWSVKVSTIKVFFLFAYSKLCDETFQYHLYLFIV